MQFYEGGKIPQTPNMYFVYGDGGTGKTSLLKQFKGKKLIFSFDMSTNPLKDVKDVDAFVVEENDGPNIQNTVQDLLVRAVNSGKYDVICLDNMSALQNLVLENIDNKAKDNRQNYQKLQLWFRSLGMYLRNSGVTVYATAHQISIDPTLDKYMPDMNEKTFNAFTSMFDLVGRIYVKGDERMIDLDPEQGNHAKNRIDNRKLIKANELIKEDKEDK